MDINIERIIVSGDVLRPSGSVGSSQNINIVWLYHLLSSQLKVASGHSVERVTWGEEFNTPLFYKLQGLQPTVVDWLLMQGSTTLSPAALNYIYDCYKDSFVVGFELPRILTRAFDRLGIYYIDLILHPVRFLPDLFFGMRTNSRKMADILKSWSADESCYYEAAGLHKAMLSRKNNFGLAKDSALFVGQTEVDRSRILNGELVSFSDYEYEISRIFKEHDSIYFKPHPFAVDLKSDLNYLKRFGAVQFASNNVYQFLSSENLSLVTGLSSSVIFEARYWGVDSRYLFRNPFLLSEDVSCEDQHAVDAYVPIFSSSLNVGFWESLFGCQVTRSIDKYFLPKNRLRHSLGMTWGYEFLENLHD